ncbi:PREDICTED: myeloid leukemia factor isoform X2 [Nicrophorus vespilloides]|uniref:Myeloid leukemia factor isoform X2 n=1 Tax=Nicrophorus vespilloides TaxID=110193 RepID=A0ABM1M2M6_NICVS|nr:PREDICTED: myeloid leukemia factor isoform X2 [Nicrophorus vespilloides]
MSLFGSLMGDMEEDPFFGSHMRTMRQMNNMMNSLFTDPFGMMNTDFNANRSLAHHHHHRNSISNIHNALMNFNSFSPIHNFNRLLTGSLDSLSPPAPHAAHSYSSSTVVSMTSGPDGRQQVYKATSSTRTAPGGVKETQRTVCDSRTGTKKMAIGHHIGERAHIIEREQNLHSGDQEERQDFINIEEEEAEDFNQEWVTKSKSRSEIPRITAGGSSSRQNRHSYSASSGIPAITAGPSRRPRDRVSSPLISTRRGIRSSPLALPPTISLPRCVEFLQVTKILI